MNDNDFWAGKLSEFDRLDEKTHLLMNAIDNFHHKRLKISLGQLRERLDVLIKDSISLFDNKTITLTKEEYDRLIQSFKDYNEYQLTVAKLFGKEPKKIDIEVFKKNNVEETEDGMFSVKCETETLGCYCKANNSNVRSQIKLLRKLDNDNLPIVYVHEMMHAIFNKSDNYEYIEEPMAEFGMLMFFKAFSESHNEYKEWYNKALKYVDEKQTCPGLAHYALGSFIAKYYSRYEWEEWMKSFYMNHIDYIRREKLICIAYRKLEEFIGIKCLSENEQRIAVKMLYDLLHSNGYSSSDELECGSNDSEKQLNDINDKRLTFELKTSFESLDKVISDPVMNLDENNNVVIRFKGNQNDSSVYNYAIDWLFKNNNICTTDSQDFISLTIVNHNCTNEIERYDGKIYEHRITIKAECKVTINSFLITGDMSYVYIPESVVSIGYSGPKANNDIHIAVYQTNRNFAVHNNKIEIQFDAVVTCDKHTEPTSRVFGQNQQKGLILDDDLLNNSHIGYCKSTFRNGNFDPIGNFANTFLNGDLQGASASWAGVSVILDRIENETIQNNIWKTNSIALLSGLFNDFIIISCERSILQYGNSTEIQINLDDDISTVADGLLSLCKKCNVTEKDYYLFVESEDIYKTKLDLYKSIAMGKLVFKGEKYSS